MILKIKNITPWEEIVMQINFLMIISINNTKVLPKIPKNPELKNKK